MESLPLFGDVDDRDSGSSVDVDPPDCRFEIDFLLGGVARDEEGDPAFTLPELEDSVLTSPAEFRLPVIDVFSGVSFGEEEDGDSLPPFMFLRSFALDLGVDGE